MGLHLYELAEQHRQLMQLAESDELPPEAILDTLDSLTGDIQEKAVSVAHVIENLYASADAITAVAKRQKERAERLQQRADSLSSYLLLHLQAVGIKKIEHTDFTIAVRENPPAVLVEDEALIPRAYYVNVPKPEDRLDKEAVKRDLKAGVDVPGARLFKGNRVDIKP